MSADFYIGADVHVNITYNLGPMLHAAGLPAWNEFTGAPCVEAAGVFAKVARTLRDDPARFKAMNPPNGWGTYEWALGAMEALAKACAAHPDEQIKTWL